MHGVEMPAEQVHIPQELQHERRGRTVVDLVGRADLLDAPPIEHHDPISHLHGLVLVVGDEDAGDVHLVVHAAQPATQLLAHLGVQRPEGFIQQQHAGLDRQGAGQCDALALPARELRRVAIGQPVQLHEREQRVHATLDLGLIGSAAARHHPQPEGDVLEDRHVVEERIVLENEAHATRLRIGMGGVLAMEQHATAVGHFQSGDDAQQRRLARSGRPQQRHQRTRRDLQGDVVADHGLAEALVQVLDEDAHDQIPKARQSSASFGMRPSATSGAVTAPACETMLPGGTLRVSQTLPPMTEPRPMVTRPSTVAPA